MKDNKWIKIRKLTEEIVEIARFYDRKKKKEMHHLDNVLGARRYVYDAFWIRRFFSKGDNLLDLGCGAGHMSYLLKKIGVNITASDIFDETPYYIQRYNENAHEPIEYYSGDILCESDKPMFNCSFSGICLSGVLEHVPDFSEFLKKIKKLLARDGKLFILRFPNKASWIEKVAEKKYGYGASHPLRFSPKEIHFMVRWHGYIVNSFRYEQIIPFNLRGVNTLFSSLYHKMATPLLLANEIFVRTPIVKKMSTSFGLVCTKARTKSKMY